MRLASLPQRLAHVRAVAAAAGSVAQALAVNEHDVLVASAWLHDVGYAPAVAATGFHPLDGALFTEREGFPEVVVSLVAHHTGAMMEAAERGLGAELATIASPDRDLLDMLTYADMTTGPDGSSVGPQERLDEILGRYGPADPVHRAVTRSALSLLASVDRVRDRLSAVGVSP